MKEESGYGLPKQVGGSNTPNRCKSCFVSFQVTFTLEPDEEVLGDF